MRPLKKVFRSLLELNERPEHIAFSFALGVFLGFSPLLGLHTVLGLALAFWFRLNKVAILLGVYANAPWIIVPYYAFATWLGVQVIGTAGAVAPPLVGFTDLFSAEFWSWLASQWQLLIPAFLGSSILCSLLSLGSYAGVLVTLRRWRTRSGSMGSPTLFD